MDDPRVKILKSISTEKSRVHLAPQLIFLCGGDVDVRATTNHSIRNMFMNQSAPLASKSIQFVLAENFKDWKEGYSSLSDFENDIAYLSAKVVVIPETAGSLTELGLFFGNQAIRKKMTVVLNTPHHESESFIKFGILTPLETNNQKSVLPYQIDYSNIDTVEKSEIDEAISDIIEECESLDKTSLFSADNRGHHLFLIYQLIDLFYALTISELDAYISSLGLETDKKSLKSSLYILQRFDLIFSRKRGHTYFYCANPNAEKRISFKNLDVQKKFDYPARKLEILDFYQTMSKSDSGFRKRVGAIRSIDKPQ